MFTPIQWLANLLTYKLFSLQEGSVLADSINYFIFDTLKIIILLALIIFIIAIIRSYLPPARIKKILAQKNKYLSYVLAALLGTITPFCSCSAVPLFLGFTEAGVPLGASFSFLIASPMVNEIAVILLLGMFGWKITALYIFSGLIIAIFAGIIIDRLKTDKLILPIGQGGGDNKLELIQNWPERLKYARDYSLNILRKVWPYITIGVALGALIHGYAPADLLVSYAGADKWYAVPLAVIIGIPLYSNAAGIIPLVSALTEKGVAMGSALAFMMSVTALSLPEFMILKRVMKNKLILIFAGVVGLGILITGILFNLILG